MLISLSSVTFTNNSAVIASAVYIKDGNAVLHDINVIENSGTAVFIRNSTTTIKKISRNFGSLGTGMNLENSILYLIEFEGNEAFHGAAIRAYESQVYLCGVTNFAYNSATENGGAIC